MTDENPQPDVLDEAIRQVDMALEQKLEALRQTALGATRDLEVSSADTPSPTYAPAPTPAEPTYAEASADVTPTAAAAQGGDHWSTGDAVLRPVEPAPASSGGFVPDEPTWSAAEPATTTPSSWGTGTSNAPTPRASTADRGPSSDGGAGYRTSVGLAPVSTGGDDESWAHTRTALRMLQQSSDELRDLLPAEISRRLGDELSRELTNRVTQQVTAAVGDQLERVVRTELATPSAAIRGVQSTLPTMASEIQQGVSAELESSTAMLQQVAEELPVQLERIERTVTQTLHDDVSQVERSVAENVTRLAAGLTEELQRSGTSTDEGMARVERSVDSGLRSVEGTVRGEFDRVARAMRAELDRVETNLGEAVAAPTAAVEQLQQELPTHLGRLERVVREQDPTPWVEKLADALGDQHELGKRQHEALLHDLAAANGQLGRDLEASQADLARTLQTTGDRLVSDVRASTTDVTRSLDGAVRSYLEPTSRTVEQLAALHLGEALTSLDATVAAIESRIGTVERSVSTGMGDLRHGVSTQLDGFGTGVQESFGALQAGLDGRMVDLQSGVESRLGALEADLEQQLGALGTGLDQDRVQRTEDLETVVDTMTAGWTGMAGAMRSLFTRLDSIDGKLEAVTTQVDALRKLEGTLSTSMTSIEGLLDRQLQSVQQHIADLKPAPVVVTVNHPDALISHETRGGFTSEQESGRPTS